MRWILGLGAVCVAVFLAYAFLAQDRETPEAVLMPEVAEPVPPVPVQTPPQPRMAAPEPPEPDAIMAPDDMPLEAPIIVEDAGEPYHIVRLFFATNRGLTGETAPPAAQFNREDDALRYGVAEVSIPLNHEVGHLESQGFVASLFVDPDPKRHVILQTMDVLDVDLVMQLLEDEIEQEGPSTLLYVHGFNTNVDTAARRAGQLTYDLDWQGPSFFFVWPSQENMLAYTRDRTRANGSRNELLQVMERIAATETDRIVIIAHSMGTDLVSKTLELMEARNSPALAKIKTVILAAPDIDAQNFRDDIVPAFDRIDDTYPDFNVTAYTSAEDSALQLSEITNGALRVGVMTEITEEDRQAFLPVQMIDATGAETNFFGHTYINDNATVIEDVFCILTDSNDPKERASLEPIPETAGPLYRIRQKIRNVTLDSDGPGGLFQCD